MEIEKIAMWARRASFELAMMNGNAKNCILTSMADALESKSESLIAENQKDMDAAKQNNMPQAMQDRLLLTPERVLDMANGLRDLIALPDPVGGADEVILRPNGLRIEKRRVPLGVVGIIYEARPNVTADVIGICLKSGNCVILRGGSEAIHSNLAIFRVLEEAGMRAGMPQGALGMVEDTSRETAQKMMKLNGKIDVLIPRGGASLIKSVVKHATVPVIETGLGNCHIFVDRDADLNRAKNILFNAKCSRPSVCNSVEKLLVDRPIAEIFLRQIAEELREKNVEVHADEEAKVILSKAILAEETDWAKEYDDLILGIKVVDDIHAAIEHINTYGTRHSEAIITENYTKAQMFLNYVDAAAVYINASTRFTDGGEFGFGAEMGISTQKLHARGPIGLREMTSYKYCICGDGQVR